MSPLISPLSPRVPTLPFSELSWERFEQCALDLLPNLKGMRPETAHRYGTQGQSQKGIDLFVEHESGARWAFSNKRYKSYRPSDVKNHIAETTYPADQYVILISGIASTTVRDEIREHPSWELWDAEDLSLRIRELRPETARKVVDHHFGPIWRKEFLGLSAIGTLISPADYFRPFLDQSRLFHHDIPLVGRHELVRQLVEFTKSDRQRILILSGRGGIGKTRLLREMTDRFDIDHPDHAIRFLNEGVPLSVEGLDELPPVPCLVVVDDAHRRDDLGLLLAWMRQRTESRLVLATRLHGSDYLNSALTRAGFDATHLRRLPPVERLSTEEVRELAKHVLGRDREDLADRLMRVTRDCPLVTVVGGRLLAEQSVAPELLERDEGFRQEVLNRFRDERLGRIRDHESVSFWKPLLELIAALNPIPMGSFSERIGDFLGEQSVDVARSLGRLEEVGLLTRRGNLLRLTPDVLADHILHDACLNHRNEVTGFADRVFASFARDHLSQLLRNLAELDWRVRVTTDSRPALLDQIWNEIRAAFRSGGCQFRVSILQRLSDSAYFLPDRVLELVKFAIRNPLSDSAAEESVSLVSYSHEMVIREIPEILKRCAISEACLPESLDLLWELGRTDGRDTNPNPAHPIRVLKEIAEYHPGRPLSANKLVLDSIRRWLEQPDAFDYVHTPFDILDPLFAKAGIEHEFDGRQVVMTPFLVNHDAVQPLRRDALETIRSSLSSPNLKIVLRAIRSLGAALHGPKPYFNLEVSDETYQAWEPEQLQILDLLGELIRPSTPPLVQLAVLREVRFFCRHGHANAVRDRAAEVVQSIDQSFEFRVTRLLVPEMSTWDLFDEDAADDPTVGTESRFKAFSESVAIEFHQRFPDPITAVEEIDQLLRNILPYEPKCDAGSLVWALLARMPENAGPIADQIIQRNDSPMIPALRVALCHLHFSSPVEAIRSCIQGLDSGALDLRRTIGLYCQWDLRANAIFDEGEPALFDRLLNDRDSIVRRSGVACCRRWARFQPREALNRVRSIEIGSDVETAGELCRLADEKAGGIPDALTDDDITMVLGKLGDIGRIDYPINQFLGFACPRVPNAVLTLLYRRIAIEEDHEFTVSYSALPHEPLHLPFENMAGLDCHTDLLRNIRDRALGQNGFTRRRLNELYRDASLQYAAAGLAVLDEWFRTGDEQQFQTAVELLGSATRNMFLNRIEFTVNLVERAADFGDDCLRSVSSMLYSIVVYGSKFGSPGEPFPQDIQIRDRCREILSQCRAGSASHRFFSDVLAGAERNIRAAVSDEE